MAKQNKNSVIRPIDLAVTLVSILELRRPPTFFLKMLSSLAVLLYFCQMLRYIVDFDINTTEDIALEFLRKVLFYANYSNFLYYFQYDWLTSLILYFCYGFSFGLQLYIIFRTFVERKHKTFFINFRSTFSNLDSFMAEILCFYLWAIQIPILEVLIGVLECGSDTFYEASRANVCPPISTALLIFSILTCFLNVILGLFIIVINRNYEFFHTGATTPLKSENAPIFGIIYLLKCLLPVGYPLLKNNQAIYFLLLTIIIVLSLLDFSRRPPFRERWISRIYVASLMFTIGIVLLSFFSVYTSLILQSSFFYISAILVLILIKTGLTFCNFRYFKRILHDFTDVRFLDFLAEEVLLL